MPFRLFKSLRFSFPGKRHKMFVYNEYDFHLTTWLVHFRLETAFDTVSPIIHINTFDNGAEFLSVLVFTPLHTYISFSKRCFFTHSH